MLESVVDVVFSLTPGGAVILGPNLNGCTPLALVVVMTLEVEVVVALRLVVVGTEVDILSFIRAEVSDD